MPKIVCLSDTHNCNEQISVPEGDILIHAGDATIRGTIPEIEAFNDGFQICRIRYKIFVAGNHDWLFETNNSYARECFIDSIIYLEDSFVEIEGLKIYGSPLATEIFRLGF